MADTKISAATAATTVAAADQFPLAQSGASKSVTASVLRATYIGAGLSNASTTSVSAGYAADTYLAGSALTIPVAGAWAVGSIVKWTFDMTKTAAGIAAPTINIRMGTLGTTGDASICIGTFAVGTAAADTGIFDVQVLFRTVGSGTSAVVSALFKCSHTLPTAGLTTQGTGPIAITASGASSGFNSTTQTIIGLSFNGGASFSGTNTFVTVDADKL